MRRNSTSTLAFALLISAFLAVACGGNPSPQTVQPLPENLRQNLGDWAGNAPGLDPATRERARQHFDSCGPGQFPECDRCSEDFNCYGVRYGSLLLGDTAGGPRFTAFCGNTEVLNPDRILGQDNPNTKNALAACLCAGEVLDDAALGQCRIHVLRTYAEIRLGEGAESSLYRNPRTIRCTAPRPSGEAYADYRESCLDRLRELFPDVFGNR